MHSLEAEKALHYCFIFLLCRASGIQSCTERGHRNPNGPRVADSYSRIPQRLTPVVHWPELAPPQVATTYIACFTYLNWFPEFEN